VDINQTFININLNKDKEDIIFKVNYKSFLAYKRD
jgi:hypothetical protein